MINWLFSTYLVERSGILIGYMSHSLKPAKNAAEISVLDNADADAESMVFLALPADAITTYKMPCRNTMPKPHTI